MRMNYYLILSVIDHLEKKERLIEQQIADFRREAIKLIEVDDPAWLDWKPTLLDLEHRRFVIRELKSRAIYMKHNAGV